MGDCMENRKGKVLKITLLVSLFLLVLGLSYALFRVVLTGNKVTRVKSGNFSLQLLDENNNPIDKNENNSYEYEINIDKGYPISDEEGYQQTGFVFKVKNNGNIPVEYDLYLDDVELESGEERIDDQYIKYSLRQDDLGGAAKLLTKTGENPNRKLDMNIINPNKTRTYELRLWIDWDATTEISGKVFDTVLRIDAKQYKEKIKIEKGSLAETLVNQGIVEKITYVRDGFDKNKETSGLYEYMDSEGTRTYVYRGTDVNNYVDFAGSLWRVLRIQEDGTVKLLKEDALNFESDKIYSSEATYKLVKYNNTANDVDSKYMGSNIKAYVDEWYESEMQYYDDKIVNNKYCSDRTEDHSSQWYRYCNRSGVVGSPKLYGVVNKIEVWNWDIKTYPYNVESKKSFIKSSVSCRKEDEVLSKAALITADEAILAGVSYIYLLDSYLKTNYVWYTMSPDSLYSNRAMANTISTLKVISSYVNGRGNAVRPVVTLKSDVGVLSGDGTSSKPYVIE